MMVNGTRKLKNKCLWSHDYFMSDNHLNTQEAKFVINFLKKYETWGLYEDGGGDVFDRTVLFSDKDKLMKLAIGIYYVRETMGDSEPRDGFWRDTRLGYKSLETYQFLLGKMENRLKLSGIVYRSEAD